MNDLEIKDTTETQSLVETQKCPVTESVPDYIEVEISEVDRQTADGYCCTGGCLIATALLNRGHNVKSVSPIAVTMFGGSWGEWEIEGNSGMDYALCFDSAARERPFYKPEVVGKVIKLRRIQ